MSKMGFIAYAFVGAAIAGCLTTLADLQQRRRSLQERYEHFKEVQINPLWWDCGGKVTVSAEAWNTATDIVETVWQNHTNRLAKAQQTQAANVQSVKGIKRVREIRRARREALKGGGK